MEPIAIARRSAGDARLIVGSKPGAANDVVARTLAAIAEAAGGPRLEVVNIPGELMSRAWKTLRDAPPDGSSIAIASTVMLTSHLAGKSELHYSGFTPLAMLVDEPLCFAVAAGSPARSWDELTRAGPAPLRAGFIGERGNARHLALATALAGRTVAHGGFETEGAAVEALVAGRIDLYSNAANAIAALAQSGAVRPVAVSARRRLGGVFAQTPCLAELGVAEPFTAWRALVGPPGMPPGAIRYWEKKVEAWSASSAWKDWLAKQYWASHYLGSAALGQFLAESTARLERHRDWFAGPTG